MKIKWHLDTGFVGGDRHGEIEVKDDATDEEIEEIVQTVALQRISWHWTRAGEED